MIRAVLSLLLSLLLTAAAVAETRVALVIGNSAYSSVSALTNPVNDATDLAEALGRIGFDVTLATDLEGGAMRSALKAFRDKADGADMALVYFAGHGIEINKVNYLIPVDADLETDSDVMFDTIPLDLINEAVSGAKTLRMVLIDACRNNPFLGQIRVADSGRSIGRGLSPFEPEGGTLVAFAAKGGTVALDGVGRNSPFMKGLLAHIEEPGLDISLMFRRVRDSVLADTNNRQEPFTYGSLPGRELYLVPPVEVAAIAPPVVVVAPPPVETPNVGSKEEEFAWSLIGNSNDPVMLQQFIRTYPDGVHVQEAFGQLVQQREIAPNPAPETQTAVTLTPEATPETITATTPATEIAALPEPAVRETTAPIPDVEVAALPEAPAIPQPEPVIDQTPLIIALQKELRRAGCNPGAADGIWGPRSQRAVTAFGRDGDITIASTDPSEGLLTTLKSLDGIVCVQAAPPAPKKTTTASTPRQTQTQATPAPKQPEPEPEPEPEDDSDCAAGLFLMGPLGIMGCD